MNLDQNSLTASSAATFVPENQRFDIPKVAERTAQRIEVKGGTIAQIESVDGPRFARPHNAGIVFCPNQHFNGAPSWDYAQSRCIFASSNGLLRFVALRLRVDHRVEQLAFDRRETVLTVGKPPKKLIPSGPRAFPERKERLSDISHVLTPHRLRDPAS